jgi:tryptophan synthase alpha chain
MKNADNRIELIFRCKKSKKLSVYFTAGFPQPDSAPGIIRSLEAAGADIIEIGIPFSDPLADGPVIQQSNKRALENGMSVEMLFSQLKGIRESVRIPLLIMTYLNPVYRFGIEEFCKRSAETGIDGLIIPDLPPDMWEKNYKTIFQKYGLANIFLITPQTDEERIRMIDTIGSGFIYMVSSSSVTGARNGFSEEQLGYFRRVSHMKLSNPLLTGFGISDKKTFFQASEYTDGAIIGSAFIKLLHEKGTGLMEIKEFIDSIRK